MNIKKSNEIIDHARLKRKLGIFHRDVQVYTEVELFSGGRLGSTLMHHICLKYQNVFVSGHLMHSNSLL